MESQYVTLRTDVFFTLRRIYFGRVLEDGIRDFKLLKGVEYYLRLLSPTTFSVSLSCLTPLGKKPHSNGNLSPWSSASVPRGVRVCSLQAWAHKPRPWRARRPWRVQAPAGRAAGVPPLQASRIAGSAGCCRPAGAVRLLPRDCTSGAHKFVRGVSRTAGLCVQRCARVSDVSGNPPLQTGCRHSNHAAWAPCQGMGQPGVLCVRQSVSDMMSYFNLHF